MALALALAVLLSLAGTARFLLIILNMILFRVTNRIVNLKSTYYNNPVREEEQETG